MDSMDSTDIFLKMLPGIPALVGFIIMMVGDIELITAGFRKGPFWGVACLVPALVPVMLVFVIVHWDVAKRPFKKLLLGAGVLIIWYPVAALFGYV